MIILFIFLWEVGLRIQNSELVSKMALYQARRRLQSAVVP